MNVSQTGGLKEAPTPSSKQGKQVRFWKRTTNESCICFSYRGPGTSAPGVPETWQSLFLCSCLGSRAQGPSRAPCQLKKSFKDPSPGVGSFWEEWKRKVLTQGRIIDFPSRQMNDFYLPICPLIFDCLHPPWSQTIIWKYLLLYGG